MKGIEATGSRVGLVDFSQEPAGDGQGLER